MIELLLSTETTLFIVALCLILLFTAIEVISTLLGVGLSDMVDSLLPEFDAGIDLDIDVADTGGGPDSLTRMLAWFRVGEVPVVMLFIIFLTSFGISGLVLQYLLHSLIGMMLPLTIAVCLAFLAAIPAVRVCGGILGKVMPKDETYVVSEKSFQGMVATVTLGTAQMGKPAQAKLTDQHGQSQYILVEPDVPQAQFSQGEKTIVVGQIGAIYKVIDATSPALTDGQ